MQTLNTVRRGLVSGLILASVIVLVAARAPGLVFAGDPVKDQSAPGAQAAIAEQDFLMGMIPHHRGAVMMAEMALERSSQPELRTLAQRIINDQQREILLMTAYLQLWYGMTPPAGMHMPHDVMARMGMPMAHMMAMEAHMEAMMSLRGAEFDIAFMSAMIDHHAMALMMAGMVLHDAYHPEMYGLATGIAISQGEEIAQMQRWLAAWYGVDHP